MRLVTVLSLFVTALAAAPEEIPREVLTLARVRAHMSHVLTRLPNYTCLQTIERTARLPGKRTELIDLVRLEVALVNGRELFAWPGSRNFEDGEITDMVKGGAIGNGNFALHAKSVFQSNSPRFTFGGERIREDGRNTLRWDFVVPQVLSGYTLKQGDQKAIVGYHGSLWIDPTSLDLLRLEINADDIPPNLKIASTADAVEYHRVKLGEEAFLLPAKSELAMKDLSGAENLNRTMFTGCRQYSGESTISFDDPSDEGKPAEADRTLHLPPDLRLELALETPIVDGQTAVGDPVTAILKRSVKLGSGLVAPKGALVHGRMTHLRRQQTSRPGWAIGMTFFEMEWPGTRAQLRATLEDMPSVSMLASSNADYRMLLRQIAYQEGIFLLPGYRLTVPRGFLMTWRTQPLQAEDNSDPIRTRN
jgi:hypothetical protein